jgi:hypothetical protein
VLNDDTEMEILLKPGLILWYGERKRICLKMVLLDISTELHTLLNKFDDFPACVKFV